jgi:hypothetical protein
MEAAVFAMICLRFLWRDNSKYEVSYQVSNLDNVSIPIFLLSSLVESTYKP